MIRVNSFPGTFSIRYPSLYLNYRTIAKFLDKTCFFCHFRAYGCFKNGRLAFILPRLSLRTIKARDPHNPLDDDAKALSQSFPQTIRVSLAYQDLTILSLAHKAHRFSDRARRNVCVIRIDHSRIFVLFRTIPSCPSSDRRPSWSTVHAFSSR